MTTNKSKHEYRKWQIVIFIISILLPVSCITFGQIGSYAQYPITPSIDNLIFTAVVLTVFGCMPFAVVTGLICSVYFIVMKKNKDQIIAILGLAHLIVPLWSLMAGENTIF